MTRVCALCGCPPRAGYPLIARIERETAQAIIARVHCANCKGVYVETTPLVWSRPTRTERVRGGGRNDQA